MHFSKVKNIEIKSKENISKNKMHITRKYQLDKCMKSNIDGKRSKYSIQDEDKCGDIMNKNKCSVIYYLYKFNVSQAKMHCMTIYLSFYQGLHVLNSQFFMLWCIHTECIRRAKFAISFFDTCQIYCLTSWCRLLQSNQQSSSGINSSPYHGKHG